MAYFSPEVIALAQETQRKYGVPASVTLAQYATESAYGKSNLAKTANNYFGMTGTSSNGNYVMRNGRKWQAFGSMAESFDAHGKLLAKPLYSNHTKGVTSAYAYIDAIQPIYAPHSDGNAGIESLWKKIIQQNNLTQYDNVSNWVERNGGTGGPVADYTSSGGTGGPVADYTSSGGSVQQVGWFQDTAQSVLAIFIKVVAVVIILVVAVIFFMQAFDMDVPTPANIAKKAVKKK